MSHLDLLENCLTRDRKIDDSISNAAEKWLYLFCMSCGRDGGRVRDTEVPLQDQYAGYVCNSCATKYGGIPSTMLMPDELFWKKVHEAQIEKYGALLSSEEIDIQLQEKNSLMSTLAKEK